MNDLGQLRQLDPALSVDVDVVAQYPIFDELFTHIVSEQQVDAGDNETGTQPVRIRRRPLRASGRMVLMSAAAVILVIAIAASILSGPSGLRGRITTSWHAAHVLPSAGSIPRGSATGSWQLVGDIVHTGWQLHTTGPVPGYLTCPTTSACYVLGNTAKSTNGPKQFGAIYVSNDAGASWSVLPLPSGLSAATNLSCPSVQTCVGGGVLNGQSVLLSTVDGGHQWSTTPLTTGGQLTSLTCVSANSCNGITVPPSPWNARGLQPMSARQQSTFVRTTNAGASWTAYRFPEGDHVVSMNCPAALDCVAVGYPVRVLNRGLSPSGFVFWTGDGGKSWNAGRLPEGFGFLSVNGGISCSGTAHCMAIGQISVPNPEQCIGPNLNPPPGSNGCSTGSTMIVSGVATTTDGGATWQMRPLPSDVPQPQMSDVSCATATICWLAGEEAVPQRNGTGGTNGGSAVLLGTTTSGATWTKETFTIPPGAPEDVGQDSYMTVGQISCPATTTCVALGLADRGSATTPVYSYQASQ
jgi:hypothetical protein